MTTVHETIRRRFILSASAGLALAIVCGFPIGGWLAENKDPGASNASLTAAHLAISGVNRGLWELQNKKIPVDRLVSGAAVPGYDDDVVYRDAAGGSYRVKARYQASTGEILLTGTGMAADSGSEKSIELSIKRQADAGRYVQVAWREVQP